MMQKQQKLTHELYNSLDNCINKYGTPPSLLLPLLSLLYSFPLLLLDQENEKLKLLLPHSTTAKQVKFFLLFACLFLFFLILF